VGGLLDGSLESSNLQIQKIPIQTIDCGIDSRKNWDFRDEGIIGLNCLNHDL
jgi:hypothetical protein